MRRKSLNPKRLSAKDDSLDTATGINTISQTHSSETKPELNNNLNGSEVKAKAVLPRSKQAEHKTSVIFTFEGVSSPTYYRKCSCNVPRKDQCTQTPSNVKEWHRPPINAPTPIAVNTTPAQPNLPSPSWSQSSDSEGSSPRTPNKVKLYKCEVCEKAFPTPSKLRRHFLIHSGEKPYSCRVCGKPFNDPANLKRHHWSHIKEKPFICEECNGKFMTKRDAMMHLCPAVKRKRKLEMNV